MAAAKSAEATEVPRLRETKNESATSKCFILGSESQGCVAENEMCYLIPATTRKNKRNYLVMFFVLFYVVPYCPRPERMNGGFD